MKKGLNKAQVNKSMLNVLKTPSHELRRKINRDIIWYPQRTHYTLREYMKNPIVKNKIKVNCLPKSISSLFNTSISFNASYETPDAIACINFWLSVYYDQINQYLEYKNEYEKKLISEDFGDALEIIEAIENNICVSIWSCSQKLLLKELMFGLEENKKLLEEYFNESQKNIIVMILLDYYSNIAEDKMSYANYEDNIKKYLEGFNESPIKRYLQFKLDLENEYLPEDLSIILQIDSQFSIIDLYNSIIELLPEQAEVCKFILQLRSLQNIHDFRLTNLLIEHKLLPLSIIDEYFSSNREIYLILEKYTSGNYSVAIELLNDYLKKNPNDFQMVLLRIKSSIKVKEDEKFQYEIYNDLYNFYKLSEDLSLFYSDICRYLKRFSGITWKYKLKSFLNRKLECNKKEDDIHLSYINDIVITPNFIEYFSDIKYKCDFLNILHNYCPNTSNLFISLITLDSDKLLSSNIDSNRKNLYLSKIYNKLNKAQEAIELLMRLEENIKSTDYYDLERVYRNMYIIYQNNNQVSNLIKLTVKSYFCNNSLIRRYDLNSGLEMIKHAENTTIKKDIQYPIFVYLCNKSDYNKQRIAYSNFLDYNNISSVDELISLNNITNKEYFIFFLSKICTPYLLKRDIRLADSSTKAEEVRIEILKTLELIDTDNKKIYLDEINSINTECAIRDRLRQINQSRIFVDTEKILIKNKDIWAENYEKYISIKNFDRKLLSFDINNSNYIDILKKASKEISELRANDVNYNQEILVLKNIISRIVEELLFNENYGLETYLSSRIRHGYCKNQLTKLFYDYHLMSMTDNDKSNIFLINDYWDSRNNLKSPDYVGFKNFLSDFTFKIDCKVNEIKAQWIHIQLDDKKNGLFDYNGFVNHCLVVLQEEKIKDFNAFYNQVVLLFWSWTKVLLERIHLKIETELYKYFLDSLTELESNILTLNYSIIGDVIQESTTNCNLCKSKIKIVVNEFSDVFRRQNITYCDYRMNDLLTTCLKIAQKMYPHYHSIKWKTTADSNYVFSGKTFSHFVDVISILINNAIEHCGFEDLTNLELDVSILENNSEEYIKPIKKYQPCADDKFMLLRVANNLSKKKDIDILDKIINDKFKAVRDEVETKKYTQSEGGSGLFKLSKTMEYNIASPYYIGYDFLKREFEIFVLFGINDLLADEEEQHENIIH